MSPDMLTALLIIGVFFGATGVFTGINLDMFWVYVLGMIVFVGSLVTIILRVGA